jgi:hypothetical protein
MMFSLDALVVSKLFPTAGFQIIPEPGSVEDPPTLGKTGSIALQADTFPR